MHYTTICNVNDILPNMGACALVNGEQVAIFHVKKDNQSLWFGVHNYDPFSHANVLSRGLVGCKNDIITVASPIYKQLFSLATGECLDDNTITLKTWLIERHGDVLVTPLLHQQSA